MHFPYSSVLRFQTMIYLGSQTNTIKGVFQGEIQTLSVAAFHQKPTDVSR